MIWKEPLFVVFVQIVVKQRLRLVMWTILGIFRL